MDYLKEANAKESNSMKRTPFYTRKDWIAAWITFGISLLVYTLTLQPTVGLEDSGELIVALIFSAYLIRPATRSGPYSLGFFNGFSWRYFHGQPNPAFGVNFFSAFAGASACGVIALLISRSGADILSSLKREHSARPSTQSLSRGIGHRRWATSRLWARHVVAGGYCRGIHA